MFLYNIEELYNNILKIKKLKCYNTIKVYCNSPIVVYKVYSHKQNLAR